MSKVCSRFVPPAHSAVFPTRKKPNNASAREQIACSRICSQSASLSGSTPSPSLFTQVRKGSLQEAHHAYDVGDHIPILANVVGPYANRADTREYYSLPFCQPEGGIEYIQQDLGEHLAGDRQENRSLRRSAALTPCPLQIPPARVDPVPCHAACRLVNTPYALVFPSDTAEVICTKQMSEAELKQFRDAIEEDFYVQMFFDDLPIVSAWRPYHADSSTVAMRRDDNEASHADFSIGLANTRLWLATQWSFVGKTESAFEEDGEQGVRYILFTHLHFEVKYNDDNGEGASKRAPPRVRGRPPPLGCCLCVMGWATEQPPTHCNAIDRSAPRSHRGERLDGPQQGPGHHGRKGPRGRVFLLR